MAGGLVQLAVYGTQDIFLTGSPQITYFKIVYRRHTNFAIESIPQEFIGIANFGQEMTSVINKVGDLMSRVYLEIEIPKTDLIKNYSNWVQTKEKATATYHKINQLYQLTTEYVAADTDLARKLAILLNATNIPMTEIERTLGNPNFIANLLSKRAQLADLIANGIPIENIRASDLLQEINQIDIQKLANHILKKVDDDGIKRSKLKNLINHQLYPAIYDFYIKISNANFSADKLYKALLSNTYVERYKSAWVEELGHAIVDQIQIKIGSQTIDTHTGDWLILWNKIFLHDAQTVNYYKMIGNVKELTTYDDSVKNSYKLIIPLQFWFCRHTGLALPLIALRYHDVMFTVRLKDLSKVFYVEDDPTLPDMANIQSQYGINIGSANLYVDYIFLDTDERRRFAQSSHEYLIEVVQSNEFDNVTGPQYNFNLNFTHPTKYIFWFVQPSFYRDNPTGRNKLKWNNFGTKPDKSGYTIESTRIGLNSYPRLDPQLDIKYYNYMQPFWYFEHSPTDGFNAYSFAIRPTENIPSGTINLSRIDHLGIDLTFTNEFMMMINNYLGEENPASIYMAAYTVSYNILRIISGMAGLAFERA